MSYALKGWRDRADHYGIRTFICHCDVASKEEAALFAVKQLKNEEGVDWETDVDHSMSDLQVNETPVLTINHLLELPYTLNDSTHSMRDHEVLGSLVHSVCWRKVKKHMKVSRDCNDKAPLELREYVHEPTNNGFLCLDGVFFEGELAYVVQSWDHGGHEWVVSKARLEQLREWLSHPRFQEDTHYDSYEEVDPDQVIYDLGIIGGQSWYDVQNEK
jgi:hypothetical protein|tara:strand:+ start:8522 stop:9169 length:648 start_codon:yes stop_codon:yes gene_type:complete